MNNKSSLRSSKQKAGSAAVVTALTLAIVPAAMADTTWISTSSTAWATTGNWTGGVLPSAGATTLAIYADSSTIQHSVDLGGFGRVATGIRFDAFSGGSGFVFSSSSNPGPGWFLRAGGTANGIINNDDNTQTFNVPMKLTTSAGGVGAGAAMTFNAAGGNLLFNGVNQSSAPWTINLNGASALTLTAAAGKTITIGTTSGGQIVNTNTGTFSGLIKNGAGKLVLGGTAANTFVGTNVIQQGTITAAKVDALGSGNALKVTGTSTFETGGLNQHIGPMDLQGNLTIDLANSGTVSIDDSKAFDWTSFNLTIINFTLGSSTLQFGTDNTGLTQAQLDDIVFADFGNAHGQIDATGLVTPVPVPEPSTLALGLFGGIGMMFLFRRVRGEK